MPVLSSAPVDPLSKIPTDRRRVFPSFKYYAIDVRGSFLRLYYFRLLNFYFEIGGPFVKDLIKEVFPTLKSQLFPRL